MTTLPVQKRKSAGKAGQKATRRRKPRGGASTAEEEQISERAARFRRVRDDHASEIAEDYVELISQLIRTGGEARTVDIARRLGVSHVTVTKTIARLQREGLVRTQPYRSIFLTDAGQEMAQRSENRHDLLVRFLCKVGVERAAAEADAEGIEHHLSPATLKAIRDFLDQPGSR